MSTLQLGRTETYTTIRCSECGVVYALAATYLHQRKNDQKTFWCPNGHQQWFPGQTPEQQLQAELDAARSLAQRERGWREEANARAAANDRRRIAMQGVATRRGNELKKVKAGICPCCTASFQDLKRHMQRQHPHFTPEHEVEALVTEMNAELDGTTATPRQK